MRSLIIKLGATGDVLRTTPLLHVLPGKVDWLTMDNNDCLLEGIDSINTHLPWSRRYELEDNFYDYVINLEDTAEAADFLKIINFKKLSGAFFSRNGELKYTDNLSGWFDLSIISKHGIKKADELKFKNRYTYQSILFNGLGYQFRNENYIINNLTSTSFYGDIAIATKAGCVWPNKNWAFYSELKLMLENDGYSVNYLPHRETLCEHIGDIKNHKYVVCGDSLPMHIALGLGIRCCAIFTCTSPWEIHDYGLLKKIISPLLEEYFYKRTYDKNVTTSISTKEVYNTIKTHLNERF